MSGSIFNSFEQSCTRLPDKVLFARPGMLGITYSEANLLTRKFATAFTNLGVRKGDRVAVQTDKSPEAICAYLACQQIGGVYLPLNTAYTPAEVGYFLEDADPAVFICGHQGTNHDYPGISDNVQILSLDAYGNGSLRALANASKPLQNSAAVGPDDLAAILYTSGTTGRSKGAMLTQQNLTSNCQSLLTAWEFNDQDHLIHALPIFHTHGLFVACNMVLASGASMDFLTQFDVDEIISLCKTATVLMGVPTFYSRMLSSEKLTRDAVSGIRLFISGSAPLLAETHSNFAKRTGHTILERYGMTETCMITSNPYGGERRAGTVGFPLQDVTVRVVGDADSAPLKAGDTGAIEVKGPNVFKGYWKMPKKTASEFRNDGFFVTGDLGCVDARGYLKIVGRDKDLVISGGYNIYPKEIEMVIDAVPGVLESAVIGVPMADLGEAVTAVVVADGKTSINSASIIDKINPLLARYKQPRRIFLVDELPRNVMGKVMKNKLRDTYATTFETPNTQEITK